MRRHCALCVYAAILAAGFLCVVFAVVLPCSAQPGNQEAPAAARAEEKPEEADSSDVEAAKRRQRLEVSMEELLPLEPDEIRDFLLRRDAAQSAVKPGPASMRTRVVSLPATPQRTPHILRLTPGYSSTLMFQDNTGAPWPVLSAILGNADAFALSQPQVSEAGAATEQEKAPNTHAHLLTVLPLAGRASSNLVLTLEDAAWPVLIHLVSGGDRENDRVSDALTVFRLDRPGPGARPLGPGPVPGAVRPELLAFMHGLIPDEAQEVKTQPKLQGARVWSYQGRLYLRSHYHAVWPAWTASAENEGLTVYVMPKVPSIVLSVEGKSVSLVLTEEKTGYRKNVRSAGRSASKKSAGRND